MGTIAAELADDIVITDDNPRTEDPRRITAEIIAGVRGVGSAPGAGAGNTSSSGIRAVGPIVARATTVRVEHDRARAIQSTLDAAAVGDAVLVAGKGHENYQIYGAERRPFSDQAVIRDHLGEQA